MSIQLLGERLLQKGFTHRRLNMKTVYFEFTSRSGRIWLTRQGRISYPFVSAAAEMIGNSKTLSYQFAALHGLAIPKTLSYPAESDQLDSFLAQHAPVVVKPLDSFSSYGMKLNIANKLALMQAIQNAQEYNKEVLVQKQFYGDEVRFAVVRGKVEACLMRQTPRVVGDGVSTVKELLMQENEARKRLQFNLVKYPLLDASLIPAHYFEDSSVPDLGEIVELSKTTLVNSGASMVDITDDIHDSYKDIALKLAEKINPDFVGIDLMTLDYREPATDENYIFLEFAFAPSLRLFYNVRSGKDRDIAGILANMIEEYCQKAIN